MKSMYPGLETEPEGEGISQQTAEYDLLELQVEAVLNLSRHPKSTRDEVFTRDYGLAYAMAEKVLAGSYVVSVNGQSEELYDDDLPHVTAQIDIDHNLTELTDMFDRMTDENEFYYDALISLKISGELIRARFYQIEKGDKRMDVDYDFSRLLPGSS